MASVGPVGDPVPDLGMAESRLFILARGLLATSLGLAFASAFFLTLELDEAWIFGSTRQWVAGTMEVPQLNPALTSGGLHFVLQALASAVGLHDHYFLRIVSLGYFALLAFALSRLFDLSREVRNGLLILLGTVLSVPGLLVHCSLAFSTILASALCFISLEVWLGQTVGSGRRRLFTGLLLGLTVATRFNMLPAIPILVGFALFAREDRREHLKDVLYVATIAVVTLAGSHVVQTLVTGASQAPKELVWLTLKVSGLWDKSAFAGNPQGVGDGIWPYLQLWIWLDRWQLATQQFPLWVMLSSTAYAWAPLGRYRSDRDSMVLQFLATFGWITWFAWIVLSPLPWYRYLLPSLIAFAAIFGHLVIQLFRMTLEHKRDIAFIIPIFVVANLLNSTVIGIRHLRLGDSERIVREYSGVATLANNQYLPFAAEQLQTDLARFIREKVDRGESVAIAGLKSDQLPLAFRARRLLTSFEDSIGTPSRPSWVIVPARGITDDVRREIHSQYRISRWVGPYAIFRHARFAPQDVSSVGRP